MRVKSLAASVRAFDWPTARRATSVLYQVPLLPHLLSLPGGSGQLPAARTGPLGPPVGCVVISSAPHANYVGASQRPSMDMIFLVSSVLLLRPGKRERLSSHHKTPSARSFLYLARILLSRSSRMQTLPTTLQTPSHHHQTGTAHHRSPVHPSAACHPAQSTGAVIAWQR